MRCKNIFVSKQISSWVLFFFFFLFFGKCSHETSRDFLTTAKVTWLASAFALFVATSCSTVSLIVVFYTHTHTTHDRRKHFISIITLLLVSCSRILMTDLLSFYNIPGRLSSHYYGSVSGQLWWLECSFSSWAKVSLLITSICWS